MKTMLNIFLLLICISFAGLAQNATKAAEPIEKNKMKVFEHLVGKWLGEGSIQQGPGPSQSSSIEENIEWKLDGTIITIEGMGRKDPGTAQEKIVHHAFAVLSYDYTSKGYRFKTYLQDGKTADAWFEVKDDMKYQWGFDVPTGKIRYSITIDQTGKKWNEIGEFSADGITWRKFFEMNLAKQS
jgi:hypothetical protein